MALISKSDVNIELWKDHANQAASNAIIELKSLISKIKHLDVVELGRSEDRAIAPVASDGGECRLIAQPFGFDIIRVADSEGTVYAEHVISLTEEPFAASQKLYHESKLLQDFCERINVKWEDLSFYIPRRETTDESRITTEEMLPVIRDILEWAALVELAANSRPFKVLLLKDGALKTRNLTVKAFPMLREYLKQRYIADGTLVAGISKDSIILNKLYLAIKAIGLLNRNTPCFVNIPNDILLDIYTWGATYLNAQSFATTTISKLATGKSRMYVVDVADFMSDTDKKIALEILSTHSEITFKMIGYPQQLLRAHEYASISRIDHSVVTKILKDKLIEFAGSEITETLLNEMYLGKGLEPGGIR